MPRYIQKQRADGSYYLREVGKPDPEEAAGPYVRGDDIDFVSPISGERISGAKQMRDHMKKHGVVPAQEFSQEWYDKKAKERERIYNNDRTPQQVQRDRMRINEIINYLERR